MHSKNGKLLIFSAPSGSGKTTIVQFLLSQLDSLAFSVSATNRSQRPGEINGKHYYFISQNEFHEKIAKKAFLEWEEVYEGIYYGTLFSEVERLRAIGKHVVFDVDVVGGLNIKKFYGDEALAVFVKAPSPEVLEKRLRSRSTDSEQSIINRLKKAAWETTFEHQFDLVVINDDLEKAQAFTLQVVREFINSPAIESA
jgi:guanylate kinase